MRVTENHTAMQARPTERVMRRAHCGVIDFILRLRWLNIAALVLPSILLIWIDRRAGRRG